MPKTAGAGGATDGTNENASGADENLDTQPDKNEEPDGDEQDNDQDDDTGSKLPKTQKELDDLIAKRLKRQETALKKAHQKAIDALADTAGKSAEELAQQRAKTLAEKITKQSFVGAAKDAGATPEQADKLLRLFKDDLDVNEDGEIENLEDVIETAKTDWSELFGAKKKKVGSGDGGAAGDGDLSDPASQWGKKIGAELGFK